MTYISTVENFRAVHIIYFILLFSVIDAKNSSLTSIVKQTLSIERPYQVIQFTDTPVTQNSSNEIFSFQDFASFKIKIVSNDSHNFISPTPVMKYFLHISLIMIHINDLNHAKNHIDFLVKQIPVYPRPKCLVIFYSHDNTDYECIYVINTILKYAWNRKILDFSIVKLDKEIGFVYYLNPFDSVLYIKTVSNKVQLFPNKFKSINNYPLFMTSSSQDLIEKSKRGRKFRLNVRVDYTHRFMQKTLNFELKPVFGDCFPNGTMLYSWTNPLLWFRNQNANVMQALLSINFISNYSDMIVLPSQQFCHNQLVTLVPLQNTISFSFELLIYFCLLISVILSYLYIISRVNKNYKNILCFSRILVGQSFLNFKFFKISSRIVFLTVVLMYCLFTTQIGSVVVSLHFLNDVTKIDSFKDLSNSKLQIFTDAPLKHTRIELDDKMFKILNERMKYDQNCIKNLVNSRNIICIVDIIDANYAIYKYRNPDGSSVMYKAVTYICEDSFYRFEPASPYANLFTKHVHRVHASGIINHAINLYFGFTDPFADIQVKDKQEYSDDILYGLLIILSFSYLTAILVFIIELLHGCDRKIRKIFKVMFDSITSLIKKFQKK